VTRRTATAVVMTLLAALAPCAAWAAPAESCGSLPAALSRNKVVNVRTMADLRRAVETAAPRTTVRLAPGEYRLDRMLDIPVPGTVIEGSTPNRSDVVLRGAGMTERQVGVALSVSAPDVTIANLTVSDVGYHGIQVRGESAASRVLIHNVRIADTGQQLIKGSTDFGPRRSDDGIVECSLFEYTDHAPSDYTNGVDVLSGRNWIVRDNVFRKIRGPAERNYAAGPAILFWQDSLNTIVERNLVLDSFRGIALGLAEASGNRKRDDGSPAPDHEGGAIRSNVVVNLNEWADEGIEANGARAVTIDHNTVLTQGRLPWAIGVRFPGTVATVRNNLSIKPALIRNGGQMNAAGNVSGAELSWFVDAASGNVALKGSSSRAIDKGVSIPDVTTDFSGAARVVGAAPDAGAVEYQGHD